MKLLYTSMLLLHVLGVVVWVGGMFLMHVAVRPAAVELLQPPQRLQLLASVLAMRALFLHIRFAPYQRLQAAVVSSAWPLAAQRLDQVRQLVTTNLVLG